MRPHDSFARPARALHAMIALGFMLQLGTMLYRHFLLVPRTPEHVQYLLWHKALGVLLLGVASLFVLQKLCYTRPPWPASMPRHEALLARCTHGGLWLLMLAIPGSGVLMSLSSDHAIDVFGWVVIPAWDTPVKRVSEIAYQTHYVCLYALGVLLVLHVLGALKHHFVDRDPIFKRMFF